MKKLALIVGLIFVAGTCYAMLIGPGEISNGLDIESTQSIEDFPRITPMSDNNNIYLQEDNSQEYVIKTNPLPVNKGVTFQFLYTMADAIYNKAMNFEEAPVEGIPLIIDFMKDLKDLKRNDEAVNCSLEFNSETKELWVKFKNPNTDKNLSLKFWFKNGKNTKGILGRINMLLEKGNTERAKRAVWAFLQYSIGDPILGESKSVLGPLEVKSGE
jgi:hypothetical protein